jgi:hypothetical protein
MTSVIPMEMKKRQDLVTDGGKAADIVANAPSTEENFFLVPEGGGVGHGRRPSPSRHRCRMMCARWSRT